MGSEGPAGGEDVRTDDGIAIQNGGAVRETIVNFGFGSRFEGGKLSVPGGVHIICGEPAMQGSFVDLWEISSRISSRWP